MSSFKLDDLRNAANEKYGHMELEFDDVKVILRNVLQLDEAARKALTDDVKDEDGNVVERSALETMRHTVRVVADTPEGAERLISELGENLAHFAQIIEAYNKGTQVGEA